MELKNDMIKALSEANARMQQQGEVISSAKKRHVQPVDIYDTGSSAVPWDALKHRKTSTELPKDISQWNNRHFVLYIGQRFHEMFGLTWKVGLAARTSYMPLVREDLFKTLGFCDPIILKDFIDYFFRVHARSRVKAAEPISVFWKMRDHHIQLDFLKGYDTAQSDTRKTMDATVDVSVARVKAGPEANEIEAAAVVGDRRLLAKFGPIIAVNWLLKSCDFSEAKQRVVSEAIAMLRSEGGERLKVITERFSPYPESLVYKDVKGFFEEAREAAGAAGIREPEVAFSKESNDWSAFLREKKT